MKKETYAEYQYRKAGSIIREMRGLDARSDNYQYLEDMLHKNFEKSYIQQVLVSMNLKRTKTYEERPIYHRCANTGRLWLRLREWRKNEGLAPSYPMDYI